MASTIPAALTALVAALQSAGLPAYDGPTVSGASSAEAITVGYTGADDPTAIEATSAIEGLTVTPTREQYTIRSAVMVSAGSTEIARARGRAYELLDAVSSVLAADPTLSGAVMIAALADHTLAQQQDSGGAYAVINFGVACDAYTTR